MENYTQNLKTVLNLTKMIKALFFPYLKWWFWAGFSAI